MSKTKECYEDGFAEINGRKYEFGKINHGIRLKIFGFTQTIQSNDAGVDLSFMGTPEYKEIEDLMFSNMLYNCDKLTKLRDADHFEEYGEDYILLITTALKVFCYPFTKGTN